jgi:uncharacterized membrane protein
MLHLLHPVCVHFSVAFIVVGALTEVGGLATGRDGVRRWGATVVLVGLATLVPTLATGYLAANTVVVPQDAEALLGAHERNGWILLGLLLAIQFWKAWGRGTIPRRLRWLYATLLLGAAALALYSSWLGGSMVYGRGIGVG